MSSADNSRLRKEHIEKLRSSALSDEQIEVLEWSSLYSGRLLIRYLQPNGEPERCHDGQPFTRERLGEAEIQLLKKQGDSRPGKYRSPAGQGCRIYHSHLAIKAGCYFERLQDVTVGLRFTEGELKVEAAAAHDQKRITLGLGGVNSWRDRYDGGEESKPLVDFDEIPLKGREVRICFDSDLDKPQVLSALRDLAEFLVARGACVLIELLPCGLDGTRLGIDDLIYRHGPQLFLRIAVQARSPFKARRCNGKDVLVWDFNPEPLSTRERNTYLFGMLGRYWRRSLDGKDHWHRWTGTHWETIAGDDEIAAAIEVFADLQGWHNRELHVFKSLQAAFRRSLAPTCDHAESGLVPFRNGCLRLADRVFLPHAPEHGNSWSLPYDYDPEAGCQEIQSFLNDRLEDQASIALYRGFARILLTGERTKAFLEIAGPGNTGKSVLTNLLIALVGCENHAAGALQRLEDRSQRFETLRLRNKRLAVFTECHDYVGQLQTLKAITGDDSIAAEVKGGRHLSFVFTGGVVLTGNGPIRASDPTGAVINRRRSLHVMKVVAAGDERLLLESNGHGGWRGELVKELPGFVNWVLAMPAPEARSALARDVRSVSRMEAEFAALLETDYLTEWADAHLVWDEKVSSEGGETGIDQRLAVGTAESDPHRCLFASYLRFMGQQGQNATPLRLRTFKAKLVDLLRDTLGLPLPAGRINTGAYRNRQRVSLVPCLRWRTDADSPGVIRHAFQLRMNPPSAMTDPGGLGESFGRGPGGQELSPRRDGRDEEGSEPPVPIEDFSSPPLPSGSCVFSDGGGTSEKRSSSLPSLPSQGSRPCIFPPAASISPSHPLAAAASAEPPKGKPVEVQDVKTGVWSAGWLQIGIGTGSTGVLCTDPEGQSRFVPKVQIREAA